MKNEKNWNEFILKAAIEQLNATRLINRRESNHLTKPLKCTRNLIEQKDSKEIGKTQKKKKVKHGFIHLFFIKTTNLLNV